MGQSLARHAFCSFLSVIITITTQQCEKQEKQMKKASHLLFFRFLFFSSSQNKNSHFYTIPPKWCKILLGSNKTKWCEFWDPLRYKDNHHQKHGNTPHEPSSSSSISFFPFLLFFLFSGVSVSNSNSLYFTNKRGCNCMLHCTTLNCPLWLEERHVLWFLHALHCGWLLLFCHFFHSLGVQFKLAQDKDMDFQRFLMWQKLSW